MSLLLTKAGHAGSGNSILNNVLLEQALFINRPADLDGTIYNEKIGASSYNGQAINSPCGTFIDTPDKIVVTLNDPFTPTTITMSMWIKTTNEAFQDTFEFFSSTTSYIRIRPRTLDRILLERRSSTGVSTETAVFIDYTDNEWHHIVGIVDGPTATRMYFDGDEVINEPSGTEVNYDEHVGIDIGTQFIGSMFSPEIYTKALTADEVLYLYTIGASGTNPGTDSLLAKYPLSERSGSNIYDVSGNDNHGIIQNAATVTDSGFWADTQNIFHWSLVKGFTDVSDVHVPALISGSADAQGNTIGSPAGAHHNGCTTQINFAPITDSPTTDNWETDYSFGDGRTNPLFVRDDDGNGNEDRYLAYSGVLSGGDLTQVQNYIS